MSLSSLHQQTIVIMARIAFFNSFQIFKTSFKFNSYTKFYNVLPLKLTKNVGTMFLFTYHKIFRRSFDAENILCQHTNIENIRWEEVVNEIQVILEENSNLPDISALIIRSCINRSLIETGVSYYNYLVKQNYQPSLKDYYQILKLLSIKLDEVEKHKELVLRIYHEIKPQLMENIFLFNVAGKVFSQLEECWSEVIKVYNSLDSKELNTHPLLIASIASAAFKHNTPEVGWSILKAHPFGFLQSVIMCYMNYCIQVASKNQFNSKLLDVLVTYCNDCAKIIPHLSLIDELKNLVVILNRTSDSYKWEVYETEISKTNHCSSCNQKLESVKISDEEFKLLKLHLLQDVIIKNNVFLKTSKSELNKFLKFLEKCSTYHVVIDLLNTYYSGKRNFKISNALHYFDNRKMKILFIGRSHVMKMVDKINQGKHKYQAFLTDNMSDDDVFMLYAALSRGRNTYFFTKDFLRGYPYKLKKELNLSGTFLKWQLSHQYTITNSIIVPPMCHSLLSQKGVSEVKDEKNKTLTWHFSVSGSSSLGLCHIDDVKWICLKAIPSKTCSNKLK